MHDPTDDLLVLPHWSLATFGTPEADELQSKALSCPRPSGAAREVGNGQAGGVPEEVEALRRGLGGLSLGPGADGGAGAGVGAVQKVVVVPRANEVNEGATDAAVDATASPFPQTGPASRPAAPGVVAAAIEESVSKDTMNDMVVTGNSADNTSVSNSTSTSTPIVTSTAADTSIRADAKINTNANTATHTATTTTTTTNTTTTIALRTPAPAAPAPAAVIQWDMFPHIWDAILHHADPPALRAIRLTCRDMCERTDKELSLRHLIAFVNGPGVAGAAFRGDGARARRLRARVGAGVPWHCVMTARYGTPAAWVFTVMFQAMEVDDEDGDGDGDDDGDDGDDEEEAEDEDEEEDGEDNAPIPLDPATIEAALDVRTTTAVLDVFNTATWDKRPLHPAHAQTVPEHHWDFFEPFRFVRLRVLRDLTGQCPTPRARYPNLRKVVQRQVLHKEMMEGLVYPGPISAFSTVVISVGLAADLHKLPKDGLWRYAHHYFPPDLSDQDITVILPPFTGGHPHDPAIAMFLTYLATAKSLTIVGFEQSRESRGSDAAHAYAQNMLRRAISAEGRTFGSGVGNTHLARCECSDKANIKFVTVAEYAAALGKREFWLEKWDAEFAARGLGRVRKSWA